MKRTTIILGLLCSATLVACIYDNYGSVHFNTAWTPNNKPLDFGRVPQEVMVTGRNNEPRRGVNSWIIYPPDGEDFSGRAVADYPIKPVYSLEDGPERFKIIAFSNAHTETDFYEKFRLAVHRARHLEAQNRFREAVNVYGMVADSLPMQSFVRDRQELADLGLTAKTPGYLEYLRNRYLMEFGYEEQREQARKDLAGLATLDPKVEPHVAYALAAVESRTTRDKRAQAFLDVAHKFPKSKRAESALVMAGRSYLEVKYGEERDWTKGSKIFAELMQKYPKTRFRGTVEGWKGIHALEVGHNEVKAVSLFVRQSQSPVPREAIKGHNALADIALANDRRAAAALHCLHIRSLAFDAHIRYSASGDILSIFGGFSPKDAKLLQSQVRRDPQMLATYLDFRLEDTALNHTSERNLLRFAQMSLGNLRHVPPAIYGRIGQLFYNSGQYGQALRYALRAKRATGDAGERARYLEAASLERLGRHQDAIQAYERLYAASRQTYIRESCAEYLALLHEKYGRPTRAYELYGAISYHDDRSFVADSVLTPNDLKQEIAKSRSHEERGVLGYTLAMRYFRRNQFAEARKVLSALPKDIRMAKGIDVSQHKEDANYYQQELLDKIDPLDDVIKMERMNMRAISGPSRNDRAQAMYEMAQYVRNRRLLIYYSAGLWQGGRTDNYSVFWNKAINKGKSQRLATKSAYEHECDAHVLALCEELVRKYPNSPLVPKALYTAATSAEKLSRFNSFWEDEKPALMRKSIRYMKRVAREFPTSDLAKSARKYAGEWSDWQKPDYGWGY